MDTPLKHDKDDVPFEDPESRISISQLADTPEIIEIEIKPVTSVNKSHLGSILSPKYWTFLTCLPFGNQLLVAGRKMGPRPQ